MGRKEDDEKSRTFWKHYSGGIDYSDMERRVMADHFSVNKNPRVRKLWEQMNEEMMEAMQRQLYAAAAAKPSDDEGLTDEDFDADLDDASERSERRARVDQFSVFGVEVKPFPIPPVGELIWEAKNGRRMSIEEMATGHIVNAVRLIQSNPGWRDKFLKPMMEELGRRGAGNTYDSGGNIRAVRRSDQNAGKLAFNGTRPGLFKGR